MRQTFLRPLLLSSLLPALAAALADTPAADRDSIATDLTEIVVEGRTQRVIKYGVEYTPDKRTKKMAMDAVSLLQLMAIPQLQISPGSLEVSMTGGRSVKVFIDYVPATEQDLRGLRTEDVMRVEVLQYPEDPRFESAPYVVNYIMHKYEWGGYTMVGGELNPINILNGYGYVYSKFVTGSWTLDANAGASGTRISKVESGSTETFRDFSIGSHHFDSATRSSLTDDGLYTHNGEWASVRAIYAKKNVQLEHTLSFNRSETPHTDNTSRVDYSDALFSSSESRSEETSRSITPGISGRYVFNLPKQNFINAYWGLSYSHTRRNSFYGLGEMALIINSNIEDVYNPYLTVNYSHRFAHQNTFRTALITSNSIYHTLYAGSYDGTQKLVSSENMLFLEYMQNWSMGLSLYSRIGASYVIGRVNGVNTLKEWNPRLGMQLQYQINDRNSATLSAWWGNSHPGPEASNSALVQTNELLWLMGNPDLRNTLFQQVDVSYNFIPTNVFSMAFYAKYEGNPHKQAYEYFSMPGYGGLVRRMVNSGTCHTWQADLSASLRLFDRSLILDAGVTAEQIVLTGIDAQTCNNLTPRINVAYMLGQHFAFRANFQGSTTYINTWTQGTRTKVPCTYGAAVTYTVGDFKAEVRSSNWWNDGRLHSDFNSPLYSSHGWNWTYSYTANLQLSLSYTFSYGRRIERRNNLGQASSGGSAILK